MCKPPCSTRVYANSTHGLLSKMISTFCKPIGLHPCKPIGLHMVYIWFTIRKPTQNFAVKAKLSRF